MKNVVPALTAMLTAVAATAVFTGCEIDSAESTVRNVNLIVQGFYTGSSGNLVQNNTGNSIANLDLRQNGDQLEGVDNNGLIFRGTLGRVDTVEQQASFTITGSTTAGQEGSFTGVIDVDGTTATMQGTWVEPSLFSTFSGTATVPQSPTNSVPDTNGSNDDEGENGNGDNANQM